MGRYFEENYQLLKEKLSQMSTLVHTLFNQAVDTLTQCDSEAAARIISEDEQIDRLEVEIDELILKLLALQQPMAIDLRFLITALKITNDLERMGDQITNIAQGVLILSKVGECHAAHALVDFSPMLTAVQTMVRQCIEAFHNGDVDLAAQVLKGDDAVDDMNRVTISRLVDHLRSHPEDADRCVSMLLITRNLERIGDLSTNIAEDVVYYIEGKIIKHLH